MERETLLSNWWALVLRGLLALAFGVIALSWPGATTLVLVILFGAFALVDGAINFVQGIILARRKVKWGTVVLWGLLGIIIGVLVLARPDIAVVALLYAIAIWAFAKGFIELVAALELPMARTSRWVLGVVGALSILVGILLALFPESGIWAIILLIGIYALFLGVLLVILGFMVRSWNKELAQP